MFTSPFDPRKEVKQLHEANAPQMLFTNTRSASGRDRGNVIVRNLRRELRKRLKMTAQMYLVEECTNIYKYVFKEYKYMVLLI